MTNDWVLNMFRECLGKRMLRVDTVCISSKVLKKASDCEKYGGGGGGGRTHAPASSPKSTSAQFQKKNILVFSKKALKNNKIWFFSSSWKHFLVSDI